MPQTSLSSYNKFKGIVRNSEMKCSIRNYYGEQYNKPFTSNSDSGNIGYMPSEQKRLSFRNGQAVSD